MIKLAYFTVLEFKTEPGGWFHVPCGCFYSNNCHYHLGLNDFRVVIRTGKEVERIGERDSLGMTGR